VEIPAVKTIYGYMKNLTEQVYRMRKMMGVINEQYSNFGDYMNELLQNPTEFLNKLNTNEQFKNDYIQSYKTNPENFDLMEETKLKHILKYRPVGGIIKDRKTNQIVKEIQIPNLDEYNKLQQYIVSEKSKGVDLIMITNAGKLYGTQNGDQMAQSFNVALGQQYFK